MKECPHPNCRECAAERGQSICRLCKKPYTPPKGLFFGDPTICGECRDRHGHAGNLVYAEQGEPGTPKEKPNA